MSPIEETFKAIRQACSSQTWSRAVELVRLLAASTERSSQATRRVLLSTELVIRRSSHSGPAPQAGRDRG